MSEEIKRKTKKEIIDETVEVYSDPSKRGVHLVMAGDASYESCKYITSEGKMCAVGRCMQEPKHAPVASIYAIAVASRRGEGAIDYAIDYILKPEYRGHHIQFWTDLQRLHDDLPNFTANGWSDLGKLAIESLRKSWC